MFDRAQECFRTGEDRTGQVLTDGVHISLLFNRDQETEVRYYSTMGDLVMFLQVRILYHLMNFSGNPVYKNEV